MSANSTQADSQETIQVGALWVRFVVEPDDSNGSVSVFECLVPAQAQMPAPPAPAPARPGPSPG